MMTRIFKRGIVFAIFILAFAFFLQEAKACDYNITECTTINASGVWCLQDDINNSLSRPCFLVEAGNVIFDGQGHVVDGIWSDPLQEWTCFFIYYPNVTIKNVTTTDWYRSVYILGPEGSNVTIESITTNRTFYGIHIKDSNYNTIFNNSIFGSNMTGVLVAGGSYNNISKNLITVTESFKTQYGIRFWKNATSAADNNIVEGNVLTSVNFSIKFENSHNNTITKNTIINSIQAGFELANSHNNNLAENNITNATLAGVKMNSSNYNNITSNNLYIIGNSSFAVFNSTENNFLNNVINYGSGSCFDLLLSPKNYFAKNSMTNLAGAGFYLNASNNNTLFNNTIENVTQAAGINLFDSNYTNATLNTIIEPSVAGSFINFSYYNYFENNSFLNVSTAAKAIVLLSSGYNVFRKGKLTCTAAGYYQGTFLMIGLINSKSNFFSEMEADLGGCPSPDVIRGGFLLKAGSENNTIKNSIVQNGNLGIFFEPSSGDNNTIENNSFINITGTNHPWYRAAISARGLQKIINNNFTLCDYCIELRNSSSLIENNTISQDTIAALYSTDSEAIIKNLTLETINTRTSISTRGLNYSIKSQEIIKQPYPPLYAINKSFNATLLNENSFAEINVSYNESELLFPYEENLRMYYYNFSASGGGGPGGEGEWIKITESGVNPDDNYVWSSINTTTFRSNKSYHFAPLLLLREENVSECRTLNESGYYRLNQDVSSEGTCFNITASYVVLDCKDLDGNYHSITYSQASFGYAVNISAQDVIVKNCYISSQLQPPECSPPIGGNWCHGIFSNESKVTVLNNTFNYPPLGPSFEGMYAIYLTNRSKIENNTIFFQTQYGNGIFAGSNNTIQGNRIQNCLNGINITGSNNAMQENAFSSNTQDVVISLQGTNNTLTRDNFTGTIVSLISSSIIQSGTIVVNSVVSPPSDPENWSNISKYINITTSGNNLNINLSISYLQEELGNIKESSLRMWKYTDHWEWCTNTGVDVVNNYVWCEDNIDLASYIFAPLGNEKIESIRAPENFSIFLREDNKTVKLNWSKVDEADGYYIWYSDNVTWILQLNESNAPEPNVTLAGSNSTEWNDTTANETTKRFYALAAFAASFKNLSSERLGKHTLTIDTTNKIISLPLEENKSIQEIPGMEGEKIYYTKKDSNSDSYVWYTQGAWRNEEGQISNLKLIFGYGYYFFNFTSTQFVNVGKIPTGNTNFTINQGQTLFGWESYTEGNFTELVVPQEGAKVYYINETGDDRYIWATQERWRNESGEPFDLMLEPSKGYYCFNFTTEVNMTYERNPH